MKHGGHKEYEAVKALIAKPKTPQIALAAMQSLGATEEKALQEDAWDYLMNKSRDQDIFWYMLGLRDNHKTRRFLAEKFKANYDIVGALRWIIYHRPTNHIS